MFTSAAIKIHLLYIKSSFEYCLRNNFSPDSRILIFVCITTGCSSIMIIGGNLCVGDDMVSNFYLLPPNFTLLTTVPKNSTKQKDWDLVFDNTETRKQKHSVQIMNIFKWVRMFYMELKEQCKEAPNQFCSFLPMYHKIILVNVWFFSF